MYGIFRGEAHPVPKRQDAKHNPLQRITYLILAAILLPVQMVTGLFYWGYNAWPAWGLSGLSLAVVAMIHLAGAFAILSFVIVHIYMITTGRTIFAHTRAMISGWEEVEDVDTVGDWEVKTKAAKAKPKAGHLGAPNLINYRNWETLNYVQEEVPLIDGFLLFCHTPDLIRLSNSPLELLFGQIKVF
jgi:hypothetical protein